MKTRKIRSDFGIEILDIDLSAELSDQEFEQILACYYEHSILLFRDQSLTPGAQAALCHRLGQPKIETRKQFNFQECPEVSTIGNIVAASGKQLSFFARGGFGWKTSNSERGTAAAWRGHSRGYHQSRPDGFDPQDRWFYLCYGDQAGS